MDAFLQAGWAIQIHALAAMTAFALGLVQFAMPKGGRRHRVVGWTWVCVMAVTAVTSFWIHEIRVIGSWSPIHILSVITLISLPGVVHAVRLGNVARHRIIVTSLFVFALLMAGGFTLLPGRLMHTVLFGG